MLNKLLKRCMPWMDKGRWHKIRIDGELVNNVFNITNVSYDKSLFSRHVIDNASTFIYFSDTTINASIIDCRWIINNNDPNMNYAINTPDNLPFYVGNDESGPYIEVPAYPGFIDIWLFIRTNTK